MPKDNFLKNRFKELEEVQRRYGSVKSQISIQSGEFRFVAVGSRVYYSKNWKTFPDFLSDYLISILGARWGNLQLSMPYSETHPIIKWYKDLYAKQQTLEPNERGIYKTLMTGSEAAWFHMAYDLYILHHHLILQKSLVSRLKNPKQFQGARYELMITASFIRAGFKIIYEDETDSSKKHTEFTAIHTELGEKVSVEAKSRHRPGVLGFPDKLESPEEIKVGMNRLMSRAIEKETELPYIVCLDFNLPPFEGETFQNMYVQDTIKEFEMIDEKYKDSKFPVTLSILTNFSHHYLGASEIDTRLDFLITISNNQKRPLQNAIIIKKIADAFKKYKNIPNDFDEVINYTEL